MVIEGGTGVDRLQGGRGRDRIEGGEGADNLDGGRGRDVIFGHGAGDRRAGSADIALTGVGEEDFDRPVFAASAPGDPDRLHIVEQHTGRILILDTREGETPATPFLDLADENLADGNEQGLLGLAFHPDYARNGRVFVYLTQADGDVEIRAYTRSEDDPDTLAPESADTILVIDKDNGAANHNGGWIGFGPDGYLTVAVGDEGLAGDPNNNAQNPDALWGKLLRLDVDGDDFAGDASRDYAIPDDNPFAAGGGAGEVWALGLRNPWRSSFDRETGDLYIGDVGQAAREEINFEPAGSAGGINYGWKVREGDLVYDDSVPGNPGAEDPALQGPVVSYPHDATGSFAVVGGYVYRGETGGFEGRYVYADYATAQLWSLRVEDGRARGVINHTDQIVEEEARLAGITSFAEDGRGNLYAISIGGTIARFTFGAAAGDVGDRITGGRGGDSLHGGSGDDTLAGGRGADSLAGGAQDDRLGGGRGADTLRGSAGADTLDGGAGDDVLAGGGGADRFVFRPGSGDDTLVGFADDIDTIRLASGFGFASAEDALDAADQDGADVVFTMTGGETLTVRGANLAALADDLMV
jgi:glucose/arabinose dehydrogenase